MFPELSETDVMSKIKLGGVPDYLIRICQKDIIEQPSIEGQIVGKEAVKLISRQSRTEKRNELGDLQVQLLDRLGMGSLDRLEGLRVCHQWLEPATKLGMSHLCLKSRSSGFETSLVASAMIGHLFGRALGVGRGRVDFNRGVLALVTNFSVGFDFRNGLLRRVLRVIVP
nr:uncharacterized protein LOC109159946 [Ipomoea batatas]